MGKILMTNETGIDIGCEFYQTIIDFGPPI
jgi:hypothetical protein